MERLEWSKFLFDLWKECHTLPYWEKAQEMHDDEDRQYFSMLESRVK